MTTGMSMAASLLGAGPHLPYVAGAYALSAVVLAVLTADTLLRARRWRRRAQAAERARGASR